jgi:D-lactate dehydrogenase (cytochrome)
MPPLPASPEDAPVSETAKLAAMLEPIVGSDGLIIDPEQREALSADIYSAGATCAAVLRPADRHALAQAIGLVTTAGYAVIPRGGGMTYTGGYTPPHEHSVIVDTSRLDRIVEISAEDMFITVEAGVTWKQIHEALVPHHLRLPFFGTFSGARATVGGGLSNGALFHGTARYGTGADGVLGLEVVLADGSMLKTGQAGFGGRPFYRTYGPDLTGLFLHDCGALGVKVEASLRLIRAPTHTGFVSFAVPDIMHAALLLAEITRSGAAEEVYVFDPNSTRKNLDGVDLSQAIRTLSGVLKGQGSWLKGLKEGARLVAAGRDFVPEHAYSVHVACAGRNAAAVGADLEVCRSIAAGGGAAEIPNSIPKAVRANPFPPPQALGNDGERWAALNAKVAHADAIPLIEAAEALLDRHAAEMERAGVWMSRLMIGIGNHAFSYEPVFHWKDSWLPIHRLTVEPATLASHPEPGPNLAARTLVHDLRSELVELFRSHGAASNQIGRTYPYLAAAEPDTRRVIEMIKHGLDPRRVMNPGVLGLG